MFANSSSQQYSYLLCPLWGFCSILTALQVVTGLVRRGETGAKKSTKTRYIILIGLYQ